MIVHGTCEPSEYFSDIYPSLSNSHWLPWLQKQFLMNGYTCQSPEMPDAWMPEYGKWRAVFERQAVGPGSVLVGHSTGGGFLLRWLCETRVRVKRTVLVAPWLDPTARKCPAFFNFKIDPAVGSRTDLHIVTSDNDAPEILQSVEIMRKAVPAHHFHLFPGYGHFCLSNMKTDRFPELAAIALDTPLS